MLPFDQTFEAQRPKLPAGLPPMLHLLGAGLLCLAAAFVMPVPSLYFGLAICGGILIVTGGFVGIARERDARAGRRLRAMADAIITHDTGVGFVTDGAGAIRYANAGAESRFGETVGTRIY